MLKKAFLVQTTFLSRVVVEVSESGEVTNWDDLVSQVKDSIITKIKNDETEENIETTFSDEEVPYNPETDIKI